MAKNLLALLCLIVVLGCASERPRIKCSDLNKTPSASTDYIKNRHYEGFIFPKNYKPPINVEGTSFTPTNKQVERAEVILLEKEIKYGSRYKRQYFGNINYSGDSLVYIRLMKNGFREECFDTKLGFGLGDYFEKNQRIKAIDLSTGSIEE